MQQHTIHFWTHLVVLSSLEQEGGAAFWENVVIKLCHQSGILWIYGQQGTRKKTRLNHDVSGLQIRALERGQSSWLGIPSWMTVQNVFFQNFCNLLFQLMKYRPTLYMLRIYFCSVYISPWHNTSFKVWHSLDLWGCQDNWELWKKQGWIMTSVIFRSEL